MNKLAALLGTLAALSAHASSFSTDVSDLWWNPNESGWGLNVIQQNDILFATMFVYSSSGAPAWYVGSAVTFQSNNGGVITYSGPLYQTAGPYFGGGFNPANVTNRPVGTITLRLTDIANATLTYSVDGLTVTKAITRQTWRNNNLSGTYVGATIGTYSGCPSGNGYSEEAGIIGISHNGASISVALSSGCVATGTYRQFGRMGDIEGTISCTNGAIGQFVAFELEPNISGLTGRAMSQYGACRWEGRIGGLRRGG
jgi:hypothetical protein